jgi:hypothetical protein
VTNDKRTYAGDGVVVADALGQEAIADLPSEDGRTLSLVVGYLGDHAGRRHSRFRASDSPRFDRPGLVIPFS